jgi:hypothetical protein
MEIFDDPLTAWQLLRGRISQRKARLYVAGACSLLAKQYKWSGDNTAIERAVLGAEEYADDLLDEGTASQIEADVMCSMTIGSVNPTLFVVCRLFGHDAVEAAERVYTLTSDRVIEGLGNLQRELFSGLVHDVHGDCLNRCDITIKNIAERIYVTRGFSDLPILADALEENGCPDGEVLNHCRQPGEHRRGCWVVDALLGLE